MRRALLWSGLGITVLLVALAVVVNVRAIPAGAEPVVDLSLPVDVGNGTRVPLGDVLDRLRLDQPLASPPPSHAPEPVASKPASATSADAADADAQAMLEQVRSALAPLTPFFLAEQQRREGNPDQAIALYRSIPRS